MKTKKAKVLARVSAEDWAKIPELDEEKVKTKKATKAKPLRGGALARAAVNQILLHPETWDQSSWHSDCGTKHCFGGWCQILAGKKADNDTAEEDAAKALGLDFENEDDSEIMDRVFYGGATLDQLYGFAATHGVKRKDLKPFKE